MAPTPQPYEDDKTTDKAADKPVKDPGAGKTGGGKPTGEDQAAANREVDPPA